MAYFYVTRIRDGQGQEGLRVLECRGLDGRAEIPEQLAGLPVRELAPYLFSAHKDYDARPEPEAFWTGPEETAVSLPLIKGDRLEELRLPSGLRKVGAYALYNCESCRKLEFYSTIEDWGAGVFTGCRGIRRLTVHEEAGHRSCFQEVLTEIRQMLRVEYLGEVRARLIFPEFFEEAVENTPARILVTETHGCGKQYRNAFAQNHFSFREYDRLFPYVQVQEPEDLVMELAAGRLMVPGQLTEEARQIYMEHLQKSAAAAASLAVRRQNMELLNWLLSHLAYRGEQLDQALDDAGRLGDAGASAVLMEQRRRLGAAVRHRFQL